MYTLSIVIFAVVAYLLYVNVYLWTGRESKPLLIKLNLAA